MDGLIIRHALSKRHSKVQAKWQAGTSIVRSSTVTRHAAPMGQCTGPHLSVGSLYYNAEVYPYSVWREQWAVCSEPLIPPERGGLPSVQWALHPSWERRFTQCAVGPSSFLREEVYPVCSGPFIPPERGGLPSVQWALHPSWEMRFSQCAVGPLSLLREEVYRVCSGPLIPPERGGLPSVQWAPYPSWERRFT